MANIGRTWKRLFERDFGIRINQVFQYLPERWRLAPFPGLGSNCIRFANRNMATDVGVADYVNGKVVWTCAPPDAITPGAYARLEWILTGDSGFAKYWTYWGIGSVDIYRTSTEGPISNFPFLSNFGEFEWLVSPTPTCVPGRVGWSPWLWSYGPPS